jgi:hypothetical protein
VKNLELDEFDPSPYASTFFISISYTETEETFSENA